MASFSSLLFFLIFSFELITDSEKVKKLCEEILCPLPPAPSAAASSTPRAQ